MFLRLFVLTVRCHQPPKFWGCMGVKTYIILMLMRVLQKIKLLYSRFHRFRVRLTPGFISILILSQLAGMAQAQSPVSLTLDTQTPGPVLPDQFAGVSYETQQMLPDFAGRYYFSPSNQPLVNMFRTLGIKSLRIGGNTADNNTIEVPGHAAIDSLFAFAKSTGVHVIYTLRLKQGNPAQDAALAQYIAGHYSLELSCFAIGNEPNIYFKQYPAYRAAWKSFMNAILAAVPNAQFCGPSAITPAWAAEFARDFDDSGHLKFVCIHNYPGGAGNKVKDPALGRSSMLSLKWTAGYEKLLNQFAPAVGAGHLSYRLEEANSFFNGGALNVSDTYTSSLWALDYLYWWAFHGAAGVNFHTGDFVAAGNARKPCRYALFWTAPDGYKAHPEAYGVLAFSLAAHGREIPVKFTSNPDAVSLTAYGILAPDGTLYLTLINKDNGANAHDAAVSLNINGSYSHGELMQFTAGQNDLALTTNVTFGGSAIQDDGTWNGVWSPLASPASDGQFTLEVPASSAVVIKFLAY
jgi:hypothetical protein